MEHVYLYIYIYNFFFRFSIYLLPKATLKPSVYTKEFKTGS